MPGVRATPLRRRPMPSAPWRLPVVQFLAFSAVGTMGFGVDVGVMTAARNWLGWNLYGSRILSYLVAATATWLCNRNLTFRDRPRAPAARQWLHSLLAGVAGGLLNYGTFAALVAGGGWFRLHPAAAVAAGSLAGLAVNFTLSRRLVFR